VHQQQQHSTSNLQELKQMSNMASASGHHAMILGSDSADAGNANGRMTASDHTLHEGMFAARPSSGMAGVHGGLAGFHGSVGVEGGGSSSSGGSSMMGSPFQHADPQTRLQQHVHQQQPQQQFQFLDPGPSHHPGLFNAGIFESDSSHMPHLQNSDQFMRHNSYSSASQASLPHSDHHIHPTNPNSALHSLFHSPQQFDFAQQQQQQQHHSQFPPQHSHAQYAHYDTGGRLHGTGDTDRDTFMQLTAQHGLPEELDSGHAHIYGSVQRRSTSSPHIADHAKRWVNHTQSTAPFGRDRMTAQMARMDHTNLGAPPGPYAHDVKPNISAQASIQQWTPQNFDISYNGRPSTGIQDSQAPHRGSMSMATQAHMEGMPPPSSMPSHFLPKSIDGGNHFDFTEHSLSDALANNAHISSSNPADPLRRFPPQGTPTILEEDEQAFQRHQNAVFASSTPQQTPFQAMHIQHNEFGDPGGAPLSLQLQTQPVSQHLHSFAQHEHTGAASVSRRIRPNLRPTTYQQYTNININALEAQQLHDTQDCLPYIDDIIFNYLSTPSRLGLGERTVMIMTSKVAQKSYGAEKRFLCPPPMVILVGSSWWSACKQAVSSLTESQGGGDDGSGSVVNIDDSAPTILTPPRLSISMSGEGAAPPQEGVLEWATSNGKLIDTDNPSSEFAISGRSIGRQLFINDSDEKRRHCEAHVHLTVPAAVASDRRPLGVFASKPIKVISKPSKKRQSTRNSELGVNHGSTISLFHRLRSQTVSTRYLCVSGAPTWFKGSDGNPFLNTDSNTHIPNQGDPPSCFVAKTSSWDPFIVYLVDPHTNARDSNPATQQAQAANQRLAADGRPAHYPSPPINSLPFSQGGKAIHYNQPVVLQCLNTAVVSPVMVIRKADRGTVVIGSGDPFAPFGPNGPPSGDTYGEPVSQLHRIAFEVLEDSSVSSNEGGPGQSGHFLGCLDEDVGLRKPISERQWAFNSSLSNVSTAVGGSSNSQSRPSTPSTPITPMVGQLPASTSSIGGGLGGSVDPIKTEGITSPSSQGPPNAHSRIVSGGSSAMQGPYPSGQGLAGSRSSNAADQSADGGKVKRPRRVSSSSLVQQKERAGGSAKGRKRGQSLSVIGLQNQLQMPNQSNASPSNPSRLSASSSLSAINYSQQLGLGIGAPNGLPASSSDALLRRTSSFANSVTNSEASSFSISPGFGQMTWTVEVHDSDVWTIVGVDIARHTFYLPPTLIGGAKAKADGVDASIAHLVTVPAPQRPITPMPVVIKYTGGTSTNAISGHDTTTTGGGVAVATANAAHGKPHNHVVLTGMNLSPDLFIYFGDWRSTHVSVINPNTIYCAPPPPLDDVGLPRDLVPIILVRRDGVIFPTDCIYQP
jgi:hypothetical protein